MHRLLFQYFGVTHSITNYLIISFFVLFSNLLPLSLHAKELDMQLLNAYPSQSVEKMFYAPPYYGVIIREGNDCLIQFYERVSDGWILHHEKIVSIPGNEGIEDCEANESLLVLTYNLPNQATGYQVLNIEGDDGNADIVELPIERQELEGTVFEGQPSIIAIRIKERTVYLLVSGHQGNRLVQTRYNTDLTKIEHHTALIPSDFSLTGFDLLGDSILYVSDSTSEAYKGIGLAHFTAEGQLEFDSSRWFYEAQALDGKYLVHKPYTISVSGSMAYIGRQIGTSGMVPTWINPTTGFELLVADFSNRKNPLLQQILPDTSWPPSVSANENRMALNLANGQIALFERTTNQWTQTALIENDQTGAILGNHILLFGSQAKPEMYDVSNLQAPVSIEPPAKYDMNIYDFAVAGNYAYLISDMSGKEEFIVLQIDDSNTIREVSRESLPYEWSTVEVFDSWLAITNSLDQSPRIYRLNEDGSLGNLLSAPVVPDTESIRSLLAPVWNETYYVSPYNRYIPGGPAVYPNVETVVRVYNRQKDGVGSLISTMFLSREMDSSLILAGDYMIAISIKTISDKTYNTLPIYSLQTPESPQLAAEYLIPLLPDSIQHLRDIEGISYNSNLKLLAYSDNTKSGLIDLSDPKNPRHLDYFLPAAESALWQENHLVLVSKEEMAWYQLDEQMNAQRIGQRILPISPSFAPFFSGNRMIASRQSRGMVLYEIHIDQSGAKAWELY